MIPPIHLRRNVLLAALGILVCLALGTYLRVYQLGVQPYWMDEGYTINAVLAVAERGSTTLDSGQYYFCPLYCYPTHWLAEWFGPGAFAYRLLAAVAGMLSIGAVYLVARELFSKNVALLSAFFMTFSYWQVAWSRQARWYTLFELFFWLAIYTFYKAYYGNQYRAAWGVATLAFTTLAVVSHGLGYVLPGIFAFWIAADTFSKKHINGYWKGAALGFVGVAAVMALLELYIRPGTLAALWSSITFAYELPYYLNFYLRSWWVLVVFVLVALWHKKNIYKKEILLLVCITLAYLLPLSFLTNIVHYRYLFHITPVLIILGSVGIIQTLGYVHNRWHKAALLGVVAAAFFISGQGVLYPTHAYMLEADNPETLGQRPHYAYTPQPDWNSAYGYIHANRQQGDIVISSMPQFNKIFLQTPGYWIQYDYLGVGAGTPKIVDGREGYVGAQVVANVGELEQLMASNHGYIVFDYMATNNRIDPSVLAHIRTHTTLAYHKKTNAYSEVWVYRF